MIQDTNPSVNRESNRIESRASRTQIAAIAAEFGKDQNQDLGRRLQKCRRMQKSFLHLIAAKMFNS